MSTGHGPHHVADTREGERIYNKALNDPRFQAVLSRGFGVSYDYDIPYLGGYSKDGATIYVDRDTPEQIKRGNRVYPIRPDGLVRGIFVHEHWEKSALAAWGWSYDESHELATHAEHHYVREVLQMDPAEYEEVLKPIINMAAKKLHAQAAQWPPDIDKTPYE